MASKYIKSSKIPVIITILFLFYFSNHYANTLGSGYDAKALNLREQCGLNMAFYKNHNRLIDTLRSIDYGSGIVELDDGIVAYSLKIPSISGTGFCMDKEAFNNFKHGNLLELAHRRGIHALASAWCFPTVDTIYRTSESIKKFLNHNIISHAHPQNLDKWKFKLIFKDTLTDFKMIGFEPK